MNKIILASKSPRRAQLLSWAEIPFEVIVAETDESFPEHLSPSDAAMYIARNKAFAVKESLKTDTILAADTIVVLDGRIIGKPRDREDGIEILKALSGRTHEVITGVCIFHNDKETLFADVTEVEFHGLTSSQIEYYMDNYKPYDKAGAYAIQEWIGVVGIKSIRGDFYNVMGLPVSRVLLTMEENLHADGGNPPREFK